MAMIDGAKIDPTLFPPRHTSPARQGRRYPARSLQADTAPNRAVHSPPPPLITQLAVTLSLSPAIQPLDHPAVVWRLSCHFLLFSPGFSQFLVFTVRSLTFFRVIQFSSSLQCLQVVLRLFCVLPSSLHCLQFLGYFLVYSIFLKFSEILAGLVSFSRFY